MSVPQASQPIQIRPIINYPREAQTGQTYLMSIDVQLASPDATWPFPEEEYPITFILNTQPYFRYESLNGEREPGIVLHRFGGTYGPAQYLLTASEQEVERGHISITFLNGWDVPMTYLELECVVKAELATDKEREITVFSEKKVSAASKASLIVEEERLSSAEIESAETTEVDGLQEAVAEGTIRLDLIVEQLKQAGWTLYHTVDEELVYYFANRNRREGIAIAGHPGIPDGYLLFIARQLVGLIKTRSVGVPLTSVEATETLIGMMERSLSISIIRTGYSTLPFFYGITDGEILFTNYLEPESQSRRVFTFHRPETLVKWLEQAPPNVPALQNNLFRSHLKRMPTLQRKGLRQHQFEAIGNLESSLALNHRHSLLQMETGTGVTFAALNIIHRLLKYGGARRILYALDIPRHKDYVIEILQEFVPADETIKFIDLYDTDYMRGNRPDPSASVHIATLEQFYTAFVADLSTNSSPTRTTGYPEVNYNSTFPIEYFDAIILGNWDSHLQQTWQTFLDYFDAFVVSITEDADEQLMSQFANNLVYEQAGKLSQTVTYRDNAFIFTTLPIEHEAVRRHLSMRRRETDGEVVYERGEFADRQGQWHWDVGIIQLDASSPEAALEAQKAVAYFDPSVILFVGIATGLNDAGPGDVVVADMVASYDSYGLNTTQEGQLTFLPRSAANGQLLQKARIESHMHNWRRRIRYNEQEQTLENLAPRVLIGQLMTTSAYDTASRFLKHFPNDALAMELDSRDLFYTVYNDVDLSPETEILIIRGIADQQDSPKEIHVQERAAHHAAAFAFEMLAKLGLSGAAKLDAELSASSAMATPDMTGKFEIFCASAREDRALVQQLQSHLAVLTRQGNITAWDESKIMPGQDWKKEIEKHLNTARVILVCISPDFFATEQFSSLSWQSVLERQRAGEVVIIPIVLRPAEWQNTAFRIFQMLPRNGRAVSLHRSTDQACAEVAQEITRVVERLRAGEA
ncbi:MAG TPA: TIR domain-containing protein [Ktedonosporobacter sp.]|jgi:nucleoside phosphorylase|nr:TIR domain-containing protein [Ktedonosporobacter sp.]